MGIQSPFVLGELVGIRVDVLAWWFSFHVRGVRALWFDAIDIGWISMWRSLSILLCPWRLCSWQRPSYAFLVSACSRLGMYWMPIVQTCILKVHPLSCKCCSCSTLCSLANPWGAIALARSVFSVIGGLLGVAPMYGEPFFVFRLDRFRVTCFPCSDCHEFCGFLVLVIGTEVVAWSGMFSVVRFQLLTTYSAATGDLHILSTAGLIPVIGTHA